MTPIARNELRKVEPKRDDVELKREAKKVDEFLPGFLPEPNENKVYAIGEDDYAFWGLLFGEGRKKERERW